MTRPGTIIRWHALRRLLRSECGNHSLILDIGGYDGYITCNLAMVYIVAFLLLPGKICKILFARGAGIILTLYLYDLLCAGFPIAPLWGKQYEIADREERVE